MKKLSFHVCLVFLLASLPHCAHAANFQGTVIHITDGDTLTVLNEFKEEVKIRLNGIDCPETGQPFGNKAKQYTKIMAHGETVTIREHGQDKYGRTIGDVILGDGRNLSEELVHAGYAWWFFKYSDNEQLGFLEVKAKAAKVGLWAETDPLPPWIFRHQPHLANLLTPAFSSSEETVGDTWASMPVLGNLNSGKYHRFDCPSYNLIAPKNRLPFNSAKEAEEAGFVLAGNCPH